MSDRVVGLALDARHLSRELLAERSEIREVHGDPGLLHLDEHGDERQLDVAVEPLELQAVELLAEDVAEPRRGDGAGATPRDTLLQGRCAVRVLAVSRGQRGDLELQALRREILERVVTAARVHEVARDHRVHDQAGEVGPGATERPARGLRVVDGLGDGFILEDLRDRPGHAIGGRQIPRALAGGERDTDEQRMAPRHVDVGMDRDRADPTHRLRDGVRVDVFDERGLDRRRGRDRRGEPELELSGATAARRERRGRRGEILIRGRQPRHEASELEVAEELEDTCAVVGAPARALGLERHRQVGDDRRELAAVEDLIPVGGERLAKARRVTGEVRVDAFQVPVLGDELRRGLVTDPGHARDVVGRVALQGLEVDHLVGSQTVPLLDHLLVVDHGVLKALPRRHELDARRHELERVEVSRDDDGLEAQLLRLPRKRPDDVIRFVPRQRVHGDAERLEDLLAALELRAELVRHRPARGLIRGVALMPERRDGEIERSGDVLRGRLLQWLQQDRRETKRGIRELALRRGERGHGEERPVDQAVRIDEDKTLGHRTSIAARRCGASVAGRTRGPRRRPPRGATATARGQAAAAPGR